MSGPWDEYAPATAGAAESGPWAEYSTAPASPAPAAGQQAAARAQLPKLGQKQTRTDRLLQGMRDPIDGGAQLLVHALPDGLVSSVNKANNWLADKTGLVARLPEGGIDQQIQEREAAYQAARQASTPQSITSLVTGKPTEPGFDGWRMTGNVVSPVNLAAAAKLPQVVSLAGRAAIGAGFGGASAALAPVTTGDDFVTEKAKQVAVGAAGGAAMPTLTGAASRLIFPKAASNANLGVLKAAGVRPTIGQTLGGRWNALEEKLQSLPIMGDGISMARGRGLDQFNSAAINRAARKVGQRVDKIGQDGVHEAGQKVGAAYDDAMSSLGGVRFDDQFARQAEELQALARNLVPSMREKFEKTYREQVVARMSPNGSMLPETFKKVDSELGTIASRYGKSSVASEQEAGAAIKQLRTILQEQAARSDPGAAAKLKAADAAYANLVRVEGAAKAAKNNGGVFTPAQLNTAIQTADSSVRKRAVARGTALMQDLGNAGQNVLGNKVPNSGTWDRAAWGVGALASGAINPAIPVGLLGGAALYTRPMQRLLTGAASSRPQAAKSVAKALDKRSAMALPLGVQVGLGLLHE
jgi:hypothetical protein